MSKLIRGCFLEETRLIPVRFVRRQNNPHARDGEAESTLLTTIPEIAHSSLLGLVAGGLPEVVYAEAILARRNGNDLVIKNFIVRFTRPDYTTGKKSCSRQHAFPDSL